MVRPRVRIRFCKQGDLRLIGHRDLMRCLERLTRRAGLGLALSEGFHPKPRMTLPLPLAVGIEGEDEIMEVELTELPEGEELSPRLARQAPPGLTFRSVEVLPPGGRKARPAPPRTRFASRPRAAPAWRSASPACGPRAAALASPRSRRDHRPPRRPAGPGPVGQRAGDASPRRSGSAERPARRVGRVGTRRFSSPKASTSGAPPWRSTNDGDSPTMRAANECLLLVAPNKKAKT